LPRKRSRTNEVNSADSSSPMNSLHGTSRRSKHRRLGSSRKKSKIANDSDAISSSAEWTHQETSKRSNNTGTGSQKNRSMIAKNRDADSSSTDSLKSGTPMKSPTPGTSRKLMNNETSVDLSKKVSKVGQCSGNEYSDGECIDTESSEQDTPRELMKSRPKTGTARKLMNNKTSVDLSKKCQRLVKLVNVVIMNIGLVMMNVLIQRVQSRTNQEN